MNKSTHIVIISFIVFIILNIMENYIHYNIGRNRNIEGIKLSNPSFKDWIKIIITMIIFGVLQGSLTAYFL